MKITDEGETKEEENKQTNKQRRKRIMGGQKL